MGNRKLIPRPAPVQAFPPIPESALVRVIIEYQGQRYITDGTFRSADWQQHFDWVSRPDMTEDVAVATYRDFHLHLSAQNVEVEKIDA